MNGLPDLRSLPDAPVPDGRTVLTNRDACGAEAVMGHGRHLRRFILDTNPIESMIGICRATSRNVKRWQNGDMCLRWTAAGMLEAERQFRKIIGHKHLAHLALAVERDVAAGRAATTRSTISPTDPTTTTEPAATLAAAH
jgi:putative transposase